MPLLWSYRACRCFSLSYLNGILTLPRDSRQFWIMAERLESWNAANAVSIAPNIGQGVSNSPRTMLCDKEKVWGQEMARCG